MAMTHHVKTLRIVGVLMIWSITSWSASAQQDTELYRRIGNQSVEVDGQDRPRIETVGSFLHVRLDGMKLTKEEFASLAGWARLRTLSLRGTNVTDAELRHLFGLTNLRFLILNSTEITDDAVNELAKLKLWTLCMGDSNVSAQAVRRLQAEYMRRDWRVTIGYYSRENPDTASVGDWKQVCCTSKSIETIATNSQATIR